MNYLEVITALTNKKKLRKKNWPAANYVYLSENPTGIWDNYGQPYDCSLSDLAHNFEAWELYEESNTLTLSEFRTKNVERCEKGFFPLFSKNGTHYGNALAGETGEACNIIRKLAENRPNVDIEDLADELADIITYVDLVGAYYSIDLETALRNKFNKVSDKVNSNIKL